MQNGFFVLMNGAGLGSEAVTLFGYEIYFSKALKVSPWRISPVL